MSSKEEKRFKNSEDHHIYKKSFSIDLKKMKHHYHIAKKSCGAGFKLTKTIPALFHNLKDFEEHVIIKEFERFDL